MPGENPISDMPQAPSRDQRGKLKTAKIPIRVIPM